MDAPIIEFIKQRVAKAERAEAHAIYIGPDCGWNVTHGMGALVQLEVGRPECVLAQFDSHYAMRAGKDLAFGWHSFPADHFKPD